MSLVRTVLRNWRYIKVPQGMVSFEDLNIFLDYIKHLWSPMNHDRSFTEVVCAYPGAVRNQGCRKSSPRPHVEPR
jgi:hypothetical protein